MRILGIDYKSIAFNEPVTGQSQPKISSLAPAGIYWEAGWRT